MTKDDRINIAASEIKKHSPEWERLEILVAQIQKQLSPTAVVTHNDKIRGKMVAGQQGQIRKIDVSIRTKLGSTDILVAIDAKHHGRPANRGDVAQFAEQIQDIWATGIMISDSGFTRGARDVAYAHNILLQTIREAEAADWEKIVTGGFWISNTRCELEHPRAFVELDRPATTIKLPFTTQLYKENGEAFEDEPGGFNLSTLLWDIWNDYAKRPRQLGEFKLIIEGTDPPPFIQNSDGLFKVNRFIFEGDMTAKTYVMQFQLGEGKVLHDDGSQDPKYAELITQDFKVSEIFKDQKGTLVSAEEWARMEEELVKELDFDENAFHRFRLIYNPGE